MKFPPGVHGMLWWEEWDRHSKSVHLDCKWTFVLILNKLPQGCSWDIMFTRMGQTDGQSKHTMPMTTAVTSTEEWKYISRELLTIYVSNSQPINLTTLSFNLFVTNHAAANSAETIALTPTPPPADLLAFLRQSAQSVHDLLSLGSIDKTSPERWNAQTRHSVCHDLQKKAIFFTKPFSYTIPTL